jgi:transcriptional regulator with XRE-family HTH domain
LKEGALPRPPKEIVISKTAIGERLRVIRKAQELTQAELAAILGVRHTHISGIERGVRGVTVQQLVKLCRALKVTSADVLGEKPPQHVSRSRDGKLARRVERIRALPRSKQRVLLELIDTYLDRHVS